MKLNDPHLALPPQPISLDVLLEKYAKGDERTIEDLRRRVARALAAVEQDPAHWEQIFSKRSKTASSRRGASTRPPAPT